MTSVTVNRPASRPTSASTSRPDRPSPWKLYTRVCGLNAPPRSPVAPAPATAAAMLAIVSRVSTAQGPATTGMRLPPNTAWPMATCVGVLVKSAEVRKLVVGSTILPPVVPLVPGSSAALTWA